MNATIRDARLDAGAQRTAQRIHPPRHAMSTIAARHNRRTEPIAIIFRGRVITSDLLAGSILGVLLLAAALVAFIVAGLHALVATLPPAGNLVLAAVLIVAALLLAREPRR